MFDFSIFSQSEVWISLLMLTFMEVVLGIDNVIFVTIVANKLPKEEQKKARNIGLLLAGVFRVILLLFIGQITQMQKPLFGFDVFGIHAHFTGQALLLFLGGIFLLYKSTSEIHHKLEGARKRKQNENTPTAQVQAALSAVIMQICLINIVFSFDSILTAVGLTPHIPVMMLGVITSIAIMMAFAGPVGDFVNKHPTMQMLGLAFLILIGCLLVAEGAHLAGLIHPAAEHGQYYVQAADGTFQKVVAEENNESAVPKGYLYFAIFFSLAVEMLNLRLRQGDPVDLYGPEDDVNKTEEFQV